MIAPAPRRSATVSWPLLDAPPRSQVAKKIPGARPSAGDSSSLLGRWPGWVWALWAAGVSLAYLVRLLAWAVAP